MHIDRRRVRGLHESIRQQRREALEKSLWYSKNLSETKREGPADDQPAVAIADKPPAVQQLDEPPVIQPTEPAIPKVDPVTVNEPAGLPTKEDVKMGLPTVVFVVADKGGVGKTTVSRALLSYFKENGVETKAYDTETPDGTLVHFHADQTKVVNLSDPEGMVEVFDDMARTPLTVVDGHARLMTPLLINLRDLGFLDMVKDEKLKVVVFHVVGSNVASFQEIGSAREILKDAKHYVLLNRTNDANFFEGIDGVSKDDLKKADGILEIPQLVAVATQNVEASRQSFRDFSKDMKHSLTVRRFVDLWLKKVYAQFDKAKLIER
jgi:hypothetical protein